MKKALALALLVLSIGCLEREEDITIRSNGSADVKLKYSGSPGDFDRFLPFPAQGDWKVSQRTETEKNDKGTHEKRIWEASRTFADLNQLPASFAPGNFPHRDRLLQAPTILKISTRGDERIYEFERTYSRIDVMAFRRIDDLVMNNPAMKRLLERMEKAGLGGMTEAENREFFEIAAAAEFEKQMVLGGRAVSMFGDAHHLKWEERNALLKAVADVNAATYGGEALAAAIGKYLKLAEPARLEFAMEYMGRARQQVVDACEKLEPVKRFKGTAPTMADAFDAEETTQRAGTALGDDNFKLTVRFPGPVVGGNAKVDAKDECVAHWEFEGKEIQARDVTLRAVAIEKIR